MDALHPTSTPPPINNQPTEPTDLSYQVMPHDGGYFESAAGSGPVPPKPIGGPTGNLPVGPETSFFRGKLVYIIGGVVILLALGFLAYFMLGSKKTSTPPATQTSNTKLPKVWLQQYFNTEVCDDQNTCGDEADPDRDGLKNYDEFKSGTNPTKPDSDSDGLADGDEVNIYKTEPTLKYTDRRDIVTQNDWTDGVEIRGGYDPLTPSLKFTDFRKQQIAADTAKFGLHEPTITILSTQSSLNSTDTSTWKTYSNDKYGIQYQYPSDWNFKNVSTPPWPDSLSDTENKYKLSFSTAAFESLVLDKTIPANGTQPEYKIYKTMQSTSTVSYDPNYRLATYSLDLTKLKSKDNLVEGLQIQLQYNISNESDALNLYNKILTSLKYTK